MVWLLSICYCMPIFTACLQIAYIVHVLHGSSEKWTQLHILINNVNSWICNHGNLDHSCIHNY